MGNGKILIFLVIMSSLLVFSSPKALCSEVEFIDSIYLEQGETISIPQMYIDTALAGDEQLEAALLSWLRSRQEGTAEFVGEYLLPVRIKETGAEGWLPISRIERSVGTEFVIREMTKLQIRRNTPQINKYDEGCEGYNQRLTSHLMTLTDDALSIISKLNKDIDKRSKRSSQNRGDISLILSNFNETCKPFVFNKFYAELNKLALLNNIPVDLLLGIMSQESAGRCNSVNNESDRTKSIGLFQVNTDSSSIPKCGDSIRSLKNSDCLENPITNLTEAIKILLQKYKSVNSSLPKENGGMLLEDKDKNYWRKALSAYNGGQSYVHQGYMDINNYNSLYSASLDPDDWETRKIFMLRSAIEKSGGEIFTQKHSYTHQRNIQNTLHNLSYVDSIILPDNAMSERESHVEIWQQYLKSTK